MTFFAELKRRNVIRVGVLYLIAAWLLLQITDVLSSLLTVPPWTGSLVILLLALGFFPALIFAWVYEMTPEGLRRESDVDRDRSITGQTGRKINVVIVVLLVLAIGGLIADRLVPESGPAVDVGAPAEVAAAVDAGPSIAVLPFADLSEGQDQQYFTDGLSEELLNLLVRVNGLRVASRTSSFAYRDSALGIPEIASTLKVGHVLEGSVRKSGNQIRITAQLIDAETDRHLWSENFDRELDDIFAIQDEIANAIVAALTGEMGMGGSKAIEVEVATDNMAAYDKYLVARELFKKRERLPESIRLFREAITLDPGFARAWEGLAAVEAVADDWIHDDVDHDRAALEAAQQALELDPDLSMPFAVLGLLALKDGSDDYVTAVLHYETALEKDPKNTTAWLWLGLSWKQAGFLDKSIDYFRRCLDIDPAYLNCKQHLAEAYLLIGEEDRAVAMHDETLEHLFFSISQSFVSTYVRRGHRNLALLIANWKLGSRNAPVIEWIRAIENPGADHSAGLARLRAWQHTAEDAVPLVTMPQLWLNFRTYDDLYDKHGESNWIAWHPDGDHYRASPVFQDMVRQSGLRAFWEEHGLPPQCRYADNDTVACVSPAAVRN